jgi:ubiquinone/menaquinone biosynthesis C-methylase UbiE
MTSATATETTTAEYKPGILQRAWGHGFAALYDPIFWRTERGGNAARRAELLGSAQGTVLELGAGTGLNLEHYPDDVELVLTEPEEPMAKRLEGKLKEAKRPGNVLRAGAEALPLADDSVDTVVSTLVLCTVGDPDRSLQEARRVLKPGGRLLFLEHVAAEPGTSLAKWQERMHGPWFHFACGCHTNRNTEASIRDAGFEVEELHAEELEIDIPLVKPLIWGTARNPGAA